MRWIACLLLFSACGGVSPERGVDAAMQVAGAQFVPGALPPASGGPSVRALDLADTSELAGAQSRPLQGALDPAATAVALMLDGDRGHWIALAGVPSTDAPELPTFDVLVGFARNLPSGTRHLTAQAIDGAGRVGPPSSVAFPLIGASLPSSPMVVHLQWTGAADLDLHVIDPDGVEIWNGHPSGYQPPPPPATPDPIAVMNAPVLDYDSNAECVFDGRDQENVIYQHAPASGHYLARVDVPSLCGQSYGDWTLEVVKDGKTLATATGEALEADTRGAHGAGAGRTALQWDLP